MLYRSDELAKVPPVGYEYAPRGALYRVRALLADIASVLSLLWPIGILKTFCRFPVSCLVFGAGLPCWCIVLDFMTFRPDWHNTYFLY